jgi:hypothetical protein
MLAVMQRPNSTRLAGLRQWNRLGRKVKPGEKGIMILAPVTVKRNELEAGNDTENAESRPEAGQVKSSEGTADRDRGSSSQGAGRGTGRPGIPNEATFFKPVYVFDIGQTEGERPPSLIHAEGDASTLLPLLAQTVERAGIAIESVPVIQQCPTALGISMGGRIVLRSDLVEADAFRTLAHEFAHEILRHSGSDLNRQVRETEADAAAYVVCRRFGIICDSSDYLQLYDAKPDLVYSRLEEIRRAAGTIIDGILRQQEALDNFKAGRC